MYHRKSMLMVTEPAMGSSNQEMTQMILISLCWFAMVHRNPEHQYLSPCLECANFVPSQTVDSKAACN